MGKQDERLDLNLIPVFDALLKYRNVTRAAAALNMSQSGVSHALGRLRDFFGDPLFIRGGAGIMPTPRAERLATGVGEIVGLVEGGLLSEAAFEPAEAKRTLTICMAEMGEILLLPELLSALKRRAPGCTVRTFQVSAEQTCAMLSSGEVDLAIGRLPTWTTQIYQQKLYSHGRVVLGHRSTFSEPTISLDRYCAADHIGIDSYASGYSPIDVWLTEMGRTRRVPVVVQHHLVAPYLIEADPALLATVTVQLASMIDDHPKLTMLTPEFELPDIEIYQYWHFRFRRDPFHVWLRGLVAEAFMNRPNLRPRRA